MFAAALSLQDMKHYQLYEGNCHCSLIRLCISRHAPIKLDGQHFPGSWSIMISRRETAVTWLNPILLYVWDRVAREFVCARNSVYPSAQLRTDGGAWPSCAFVKWSASSLSCPLSTLVQRPDRRDKGRPGTCSPMFINKPRRSCPTILPSQYVWKRTQVITLLA